MITYLKMKHAEWKVKKMFFSSILTIINNRKDILKLMQKVYTALKDVPMDDFQEDFQEKFQEETI